MPRSETVVEVRVADLEPVAKVLRAGNDLAQAVEQFLGDGTVSELRTALGYYKATIKAQGDTDKEVEDDVSDS